MKKPQESLWDGRSVSPLEKFKKEDYSTGTDDSWPKQPDAYPITTPHVGLAEIEYVRQKLATQDPKSPLLVEDALLIFQILRDLDYNKLERWYEYSWYGQLSWIKRDLKECVESYRELKKENEHIQQQISLLKKEVCDIRARL